MIIFNWKHLVLSIWHSNHLYFIKYILGTKIGQPAGYIPWWMPSAQQHGFSEVPGKSRTAWPSHWLGCSCTGCVAEVYCQIIDTLKCCDCVLSVWIQEMFKNIKWNTKWLNACNSKPSVQKPAITGESNKLIGLATEADVRRLQDITEQGYDLLFEVATHVV